MNYQNGLAFSNIEVVYDDEKTADSEENSKEKLITLSQCEKVLTKFMKANEACTDLYKYFYRNTACKESCENDIKGCLEYISVKDSVVEADQCLILYKVGKNWEEQNPGKPTLFTYL